VACFRAPHGHAGPNRACPSQVGYAGDAPRRNLTSFLTGFLFTPAL
jgi:hypothetical protein